PASLFVQSNRLLRTGPLYYPRAIGVKTGYTSHAGHNLVAAAEKEGRTLIAVLMGGEESTKRFKEAVQLFEAAFSEKKISRTLFTQAYDPFSLKVKGADQPLTAHLAEDLKIAYYPSEEPLFKAFLLWDRLSLPIMQGQKVGEIRIKTVQGELLQSV